MSYIKNRIVHDADSHTMELPTWYKEFGSKKVQTAFLDRFAKAKGLNLEKDWYTGLEERHKTSSYREQNEKKLMSRKNFDALGSFNKIDRSEALDLLGVKTQLVFPTSPNVWLESLEHSNKVDLLYEVASATNRAQTDFCSDDERLFPVTYIPLADIKKASSAATEAIKLGSKALLIPWACPKNHATSHIGLDSVWSQAVEANIPVLFHVGTADYVLPKSHSVNGMPAIQDFHGGEENFRSISYMAISQGPMQALSLLILDGVLDRFPSLMVGVIELGSVWVPGFMKQLDSAFEAFGRHEDRLQNLSLRPSEYIERQVRVTPYPTEPTDWVIEQAGPNIFMFSSDYPHVEGGRNPMGRFEKATSQFNESEKDKFFRANFEELMGSAFS